MSSRVVIVDEEEGATLQVEENPSTVTIRVVDFASMGMVANVTVRRSTSKEAFRGFLRSLASCEDVYAGMYQSWLDRQPKKQVLPGGLKARIEKLRSLERGENVESKSV